MAFYSEKPLLNKKDINGLRPEVLLSTGNRSTGKTTAWTRRFIEEFLDHKAKTAYLYRYAGELKQISSKIFSEVVSLFFKGLDYADAPLVDNAGVEIFLDGQPAGYAIAINAAEKIKKNSHLMNDVEAIYFDEFISESMQYVPGEFEKFASIHTSLARGEGKHVRFLPTIMCGNVSSVINPYFVELDIATKIGPHTRWYQGDGFVLEQNHNKAAAKALQQSAFGRAFKNSEYMRHASKNFYLNDKSNFISVPKRNGQYILTLKHQGKYYAVRNLEREGLWYISGGADRGFPIRLAVLYEDCDPQFTMANYATYKQIFYQRFAEGTIRFSDILAQNAAYDMIRSTRKAG